MDDINIDELVNPFVKKLKSYSSARDEFSSNDDAYTFLDANENPFTSDFNRYPDPHHHELRHKIAQIKGVDKDQLLLGNGSDEVIDLLMRTFCRSGQDEMISITPTYGMYEVAADINQVKLTKVALTNDFQPDTHQILSAVNDHTKIIFLCSPNNPTGNSLEPARILELLEKFNGLVVLDEAYVDFSIQPSMVNLLDEHQNLVLMQTFSKAYGLAGLRLGMLIARQSIIQYISKLKPPYNVNRFTQDKALEVLNDPKPVKEQIDIIYKEKLMLEAELPHINWIEKCHPSDANFILVKVDDATKRYQQLINNKIVVRDRSHLPKCQNCLRISIGTPAENQHLLSTLQKLENA
jgi:histidinol-phosphate aminotransferase